MRTLTAGALAETQAEIFRPVRFVALDFPSGHIYLVSAPFNITFGGNVYLGIGDLGSISTISEGSDQQARGITLTLSGINPANITSVLAEHYQGRSVKIYTGFLDVNHVLIPDPVMDGEFIMDVPSISLGNTVTISVAAESILIGWNRANLSRYTNEDQQRLHPGDLGLKFIVQASEEKIEWP